MEQQIQTTELQITQARKAQSYQKPIKAMLATV